MNKILSFFLFFMLTAAPAFAGSVPLMDKDELKSMLGSENLVILDVRSGRDWSSSEFKIPGAIRASGGDFDKWSGMYDKKGKVVLYCA